MGNFSNLMKVWNAFLISGSIKRRRESELRWLERWTAAFALSHSRSVGGETQCCQSFVGLGTRYREWNYCLVRWGGHESFQSLIARQTQRLHVSGWWSAVVPGCWFQKYQADYRDTSWEILIGLDCLFWNEIVSHCPVRKLGQMKWWCSADLPRKSDITILIVFQLINNANWDLLGARNGGTRVGRVPYRPRGTRRWRIRCVLQVWNRDWYRMIETRMSSGEFS